MSEERKIVVQIDTFSHQVDKERVYHLVLAAVETACGKVVRSGYEPASLYGQWTAWFIVTTYQHSAENQERLELELTNIYRTCSEFINGFDLVWDGDRLEKAKDELWVQLERFPDGVSQGLGYLQEDYEKFEENERSRELDAENHYQQGLIGFDAADTMTAIKEFSKAIEITEERLTPVINDIGELMSKTIYLISAAPQLAKYYSMRAKSYFWAGDLLHALIDYEIVKRLETRPKERLFYELYVKKPASIYGLGKLVSLFSRRRKALPKALHKLLAKLSIVQGFFCRFSHMYLAC